MRHAALEPYVPDLRRVAFYCWLEKWHIVPMLVLSVVPAACGAIRGGVFLAASSVAWGIFLRTDVELHGTWLVNSAAHTWGSRRFQTRDDSTNNWWVALFMFGEGWHNNHHADPRCVRHGLAWYELDINWLCIRTLHSLGLARKLYLGSTGYGAHIPKSVPDLPTTPTNNRCRSARLGRAIFVLTSNCSGVLALAHKFTFQRSGWRCTITPERQSFRQGGT